MAFTRPRAAQINFDATNISDSIIRINSAETGDNTNDLGIVFERGNYTNAALVFDESADAFRFISTTHNAGTATSDINISAHHDLHVGGLTTSGLTIGATAVTSTAAELNKLDGVTATTTELNYVDGVTSAIQTQLDAKIDETASTGSAVIPSGTTAQRDGSPSAGYLRFNTTDSSFEGYNGSSWGAIGGAGGGSGHTIQNAGSSLTDRTNLNFDGTYLIATDDPGNDQSDVIVSSALQTWHSTTNNASNWDTAYGWGDHGAVGYLTAETNDLSSAVTWANIPDANITQSSVTQHQSALTITESQISDLQSYLTSETSHADVIVDGDFASQGIMLRGASAGSYSILTDNSANWNTAYGWGNHSSAGYITGNQTITLSGDASGSGTTAITVTVVDDSHNHSSSTGAFTVGSDLTVSGGDIILSGTGRIQGIDTVSAGTDAASKNYVDTAVAGVVDAAPAALDTLNELAAALGDDANFSTTVTTSIGEKLAKASNLSDLTNAATARTNLGLGTAATTASTAYATAAQGSLADSAVQNLSDLGVTATAAELNKLDGVTATTTELNYVDGVTSNIQTQLNGKQASGSYLTSNQTITLSGDATGSGTTSIVVTVANDSHTHAFNNLTSKTSGTGDYKTTGDFITAGGTSSAVKVGDGSGSMSLTTNDGYGNANICFNHVNGVPDVTGNSGRIECNVDSTSGASMYFELKSGVTGGSATSLNSIMTLTESAITANGSVVFSGTATQARYADLAERYTADADYESGTVLVFGGDEEVTECTQRLDRRIAGIVSTDPAYLMNSELEGITVALVGRVPCKVVGEVRKGDLMVSSDTPGYAEAWREESNPPMGSVIGKALENKTGAGVDVIEVVVGRM